jgi:hypothetical protein
MYKHEALSEIQVHVITLSWHFWENIWKILIVFGATVPRGPGLPHSRGFHITLNEATTISRTHLDEWSASRRDLYLNTHNTWETNAHALGASRTHNLSRRAAANVALRRIHTYHAFPLRFRLCLSHSIYTTRPCVMNTYHAVPMPYPCHATNVVLKATSQGHGTFAAGSRH